MAASITGLREVFGAKPATPSRNSARGSAAVGAGYVGTAFGIGTQSTFTDFVTFTSDPSVTSVLVAANLAFSGAMNSTGFATASVDLLYSLGGSFFFSATDDYGIARNDFSVVQGAVSTTLNDALLRTGFFVVPTNTPLLMTLMLGTGAGVGGSGSPESATSQFSNSFEVPFGIDAFVLPDGVTANAGDWLVNDRRVGGEAAIPEPATWAILLLGFGAVGHLLRRRAQLSSARPSPAGGPSRRG